MPRRDHHDLAALLLAKAAADIAVVDELSGSLRVPDEIIGFQAHQACEKALKAVLAAHQIRYRYTRPRRADRSGAGDRRRPASRSACCRRPDAVRGRLPLRGHPHGRRAPRSGDVVRSDQRTVRLGRGNGRSAAGRGGVPGRRRCRATAPRGRLTLVPLDVGSRCAAGEYQGAPLGQRQLYRAALGQHLGAPRGRVGEDETGAGSPGWRPGPAA